MLHDTRRFSVRFARSAGGFCRHLQKVGIHTPDASDVSGNLDRQGFLFCADHYARETDHALLGIHLYVDAIKVAAI
ncbi:hypothetical protein D3C76_1537840 [compost metagenome]